MSEKNSPAIYCLEGIDINQWRKDTIDHMEIVKSIDPNDNSIPMHMEIIAELERLNLKMIQGDFDPSKKLCRNCPNKNC